MVLKQALILVGVSAAVGGAYYALKGGVGDMGGGRRENGNGDEGRWSEELTEQTGYTFREYLEYEVPDDKNPFKNVELKGSGGGEQYEWKSNDNKLKLEDSDSWGDSGGLHFRIKDGWKVKIKVETENAGYFTDEGIKAPKFDSDGFTFITPLWGDESIEFDMYGNDYLSIDIDEDHDGINSFSLSLDGEKQTGAKMDDECTVRLKKVWKVEEVLVTEAETLVFGAGGGKFLRFRRGLKELGKKLWGVPKGGWDILFRKGGKKLTEEGLEEVTSKGVLRQITAGGVAKWGFVATPYILVASVGYVIITTGEKFGKKYLADCKDNCSHRMGDEYTTCVDICNGANQKTMLMFGLAGIATIGLVGYGYVRLKSKGGDRVSIEIKTPVDNGEDDSSSESDGE